MAIIVSDSRNASYDGNISTANGFYRAEFGNLGFDAANASLTSTTDYAVTFANAGNLMGVACVLTASALTVNRPLKITLQENVASVWTDRTSKELTAAEIIRTTSPLPAATEAMGSGLVTPFKFDTPYAVDTTASKWRFRFTSTAGTSNWNIKQSSTGVYSLIAWCDNAISYTDNTDQFVAVDPIIINQATTFLGVVPAGATINAVAGWICSGTDRSPENSCNLQWAASPGSSYKCEVWGQILVGSASGFRAGTSASPISSANMGWLEFISPLTGTLATGSNRDSAGFTSASKSYSATPTLIDDAGRGGSLFIYGEIPTIERTTLASDANASQPNIVTTDDTGWVAGDILAIGKQTARGTGDTKQYVVSSVAGTTITLTENLAAARKAGGTVARMNKYGFKFSSMHTVGGSTTQFDITNPSGTTFRYTYDATGTAPVPAIGTLNYQIGSEVRIQAQNFAAGNKGTFTVTGAGTNYFEVTNASGVVESNKTIGTGYILAEAVGARMFWMGHTNFVISGCQVRNVQFVQSPGGLIPRSAIGTDIMQKFTHSSFMGMNATTVFFFQVGLASQLFTPQYAGFELTYCNFFRSALFAGMTTGNGQGTCLVDNNTILIPDCLGGGSTALNGQWTFTNNKFENGNTFSFLNLGGIPGDVFRYNYFWGANAQGGSSLGAVRAVSAFFITDWVGNKYDNNHTGVQVGGTALTFGCRAFAEEFGQETANTVDIYNYYRGSPKITFENCKGNITTFYFGNVQSSNLPGAEIVLVKVNQVEGADRIEKQEGTLYKTGDGLSDTTKHNETYAIKFVPYYNAVEPFYVPDVLKWEQKVPTENIQNKAMMVGCWVKLNNAGYWASPSLSQMPRLTVNYDNGTLVYAEAAQVTDWQYLFVAFTPLTTYGELTVTVSGKTNAGATNGAFYVAEMSVLYPAGHKIELGKMNTWASALPVMPTISTVANAADVWAVAPSTFGASTIGDKVNKIKNDTGLIPALL